METLRTVTHAPVRKVMVASKKAKSSWYLWLFPLFGVIICAILLAQTYLRKGHEIEVSFSTATGLVPDKTALKFRGVDIGMVSSVRLSDDHNSVIAVVQLEKPYNDFAVKGSRFWLVEPQISLSGFKGLSTLRDGEYIAVEPGEKEEARQLSFRSIVPPSSVSEAANFVRYTLKAKNLTYLTEGVPIYFRGLSVGKVLEVGLDQGGAATRATIGIHPKYTKLIRVNTVFWKKEAVQADLGLFGSEIKMGSIEGLLKGGLEFLTPSPAGKVVGAGSKFNLLDKAPENTSEWMPQLL